jgi:hypothetical protein
MTSRSSWSCLTSIAFEMPATLVESEWLGPWAVTMRYDDIEEVLDRTGALDAALAATEWASGRIDGHR